MQPYENQLIGAFLVCLGFHAAREGHSVPPATNLFQQTPGDTCYGDLLVSCKTMTLIEFKRTINEVRLEPKKYVALPKHWKTPALIDSDRYHHLVYGDSTRPLKMAFTCYRSPFLSQHVATASRCASTLIGALLDGRVGGDAISVDAYLKELNAGRRRKPMGDGGYNGALCLIGKKEDGALCVVVESSLEKLLEFGRLVGRHVAEEPRYAPEQEHGPFDPEHER